MNALALKYAWPLKHGTHIGQEGNEGGGSQPGYTHESGSIPQGEGGGSGSIESEIIKRAGLEESDMIAIRDAWHGDASGMGGIGLRAYASNIYGGDVYFQTIKLSDVQIADRIKEMDVKTKDFFHAQLAITKLALDRDFPGQDSVVLYRGIVMRKSIGGVGENIKILNGSLSSYSESQKVANGFSEISTGGRTIGYTLKVQVPKAKIFGYYKSGFGTKGEKEFVVFSGGPLKATIMSKIVKNEAGDVVSWDY